MTHDTDPHASDPIPDDQDPRGRLGRVGAVLVGLGKLVLVIAILGAGVFAAVWFNTTEGRAEKTGASGPEASRMVETVAVERADHAVRVRAMGTVMAAREAVIRPRVSGMIVEEHPSFAPGGFFAAGAFMVQIDRDDYVQALLQEQSELARAQATLQIELGDQALAREELELLELDIPEVNRDLILRIPQVNQAKALVQAAEAAVQRAELELERTRIVAPFDGHLVRRTVSAGNNVSRGDELATFVGSDRYWIEIAVPVSSLRWIDVPRAPGEPGSVARIRAPRAWADGAVRDGTVTQLVGRLEDGSRLARIIVSVPDPMALALPDAPALMLGAFVDIEIEGRRIEDCVVLDRALVREDDTVWVMGDDDRLVTKPVRIAYRGREHAYVSAGLDHGDRVVRTNLQTPVDGMLLRDATAERAPGDSATVSRRNTADG